VVIHRSEYWDDKSSGVLNSTSLGFKFLHGIVALNDGRAVEHERTVTTDLEGAAAISKSVMVVGGFWTIST